MWPFVEDLLLLCFRRSAVWLFVLFFLRLYTNIFFFLPTSQHILGQANKTFWKAQRLDKLDSNRLYETMYNLRLIIGFLNRKRPCSRWCLLQGLNRYGDFCRPMQQYWSQLCEQYDEQELGLVKVSHSFAVAKSLAEHFLLALTLLKMTIVRMRQDNSAPGTCE